MENTVPEGGTPIRTGRAPINITILQPTKETLATLRQVRVSDITDGMSRNLHDDGLFSTLTFGRIGSDERDKKFGFIDIKTAIFHPLIYKRICTLKNLYAMILQGKAYAKWDSERKDFIPAQPDEEGAGTGYGFFVNRWNQIVFHETKSLQRRVKIEVVDKYRSTSLSDKVLVLPAGLRDIEEDPQGRVIEDELNTPYRRLIAVSNTVPDASSDPNSPYFDASRKSLQNGFSTVYEMINQILYGKKGFIQAKWGSRKIFNGTRNVITAMNTATEYFGGVRSMSVTDTRLGLLQTMKSCLPIAVHQLMHGWLSHVFNSGEGSAILVDPKTWLPEYVQVDVDTLDRWTTAEGLERMIERYTELHLRQKPVRVNGYYIGLVYADGETFKIFNDISQLPAGFNRKNVHPMTLTELFYLSGYKRWYKLFTFVTRFPISGLGSMYPSRVYTCTTIQASAKRELGDDWKPLPGDENVAREFPITAKDAPFMDSQSPHPSNLKALGGDHDGDMCGADTVYIRESHEEIREYLHSTGFLLTPSGRLANPADTDTIELVLRHLLRKPQ